jgi:hypothetical protein
MGRKIFGVRRGFDEFALDQTDMASGSQFLNYGGNTFPVGDRGTDSRQRDV